MDENCKRQKEVERTYGGLLPAVEGHSLGTRYKRGKEEVWGWGGGDLRFAAPPPMLKTSSIGREREGFLGVWCGGGGGGRRRVISAFRFYFLQIDISEVMIIYLHLEVFVLHV